METKEFIQKINELKKEKNAIILVHNYQRPEIYEIADLIGDSFGLAKKASETDSERIVFCGVDFMAESAKILNPDKKVLWPNTGARCPMAGMVDADNLQERISELKREHSDLAVVSYVNTSGEVKALSDICCTSSNAMKIVNSLPNKNILFTPDENLANYVAKHTDKNIISWQGHCYVHHRKFDAGLLTQLKEKMPDAEVIAHPECHESIIELADYVCSTSQMLDAARKSKSKRFLIGTENGMIIRLKQQLPEKEFYSASNGATCIQMKKIRISDVYEALKTDRYLVNIDENKRIKAKKALDRMLAVG